MESDDYCATEFKDYIIQGDTGLHGDEMRVWGAQWRQKDRVWILLNTNEMCPDYQAMIELGMDLLPIQERPTEKMVINQLINRRVQ